MRKNNEYSLLFLLKLAHQSGELLDYHTAEVSGADEGCTALFFNDGRILATTTIYYAVFDALKSLQVKIEDLEA